MRKPPPLKPGDTICLVSPASPPAEERIQEMWSLLEGEGYRVRLAKHALDEDAYLAGRDEDRAADLTEAFEDSSVDAVLCTRGGYGCARLMPHLDVDRMAGSGKMFLGFSDVTTLHLALLRRSLATVYAPMAISFHWEREEYVHESFKNALKGLDTVVPRAPGGTTLVPGTAEGPLVGGCLCLLTDSLATPDALNADDKILLIEDVDENPHRVDAMLTHLILSGTLSKARGVVIGEMTNTDERCDPLIGGKPWRDIVRDRLVPLGIPTIIDFPCGHMKNMLTLPLGLNVRLDADAGTLTYLERLCD